uniref:Uncharacterized protein n=1 Tax=Marseillevirus LCMAC102 TaxID=2506603 RepID=A0A481YTX5_9VIRU|nr:MAG: hypothetical protein LCMAC102_01920 [Marseillevirus LCMAC102]
MVYTQLNIVAGVILTKEEKNKIEEELDKSSILQFHGPMGGCCIKKRKMHLFGVCVHTYYRYHQRCENCEKYTVCDECIGQTNNGHYDVLTIAESDVKVERRHLCPCCFSDNKSDYDRCKTCNSKFDETPRSFDKWLTNVSYFHLLGELLKDLEIGRSLTDFDFYYSVDDCLSCT